MHDLVHLERRGIPAVGIATAPFADEAIEQACRLGMPDARMVYIDHPVQLLTDDELVRLIGLAVTRLGNTEVRFTGGEPLLRRVLPGLIERVAASITVTYNDR